MAKQKISSVLALSFDSHHTKGDLGTLLLRLLHQHDILPELLADCRFNFFTSLIFLKRKKFDKNYSLKFELHYKIRLKLNIYYNQMK